VTGPKAGLLAESDGIAPLELELELREQGIMQTFLPFPSFERSARALDNRRLGKQRVEAYQLLRALLGITKGWSNHPAVRMWRAHERALADYGLAVCREWARRGFRDTCQDKILSLMKDLLQSEPPPWLGSRRFHASHRSNLVRKDPVHYASMRRAGPDLPYIWPV
jgi:hypothetical protein